ncbi:UDP-N-acetylmuramate dehydrogenase [Salinibacterium sp. SYSU T00001]|uniref:UDP-N-acetylmuramate dehydrogenase n=1 Tax=Homoserinimonas sedimenticola TaxID=2986805 RepID=UPI0022368B08|nr:UDP-N-acetylmuramate dehydrogenase [Salinibacterium sedimenticola]MCW4386010.1 UDP-N-acetylmuramate dehydrogenase [Salinibacterium sedimenticola]
MTAFSELTTTRVGGEAREFIEVTDPEALPGVMLDVWSSGEPWLVLGGGSNLLVGDDGFDGTVVRVLTKGIRQTDAADDTVVLRAEAGESWDALVAHTVEAGLAGLEALAGIPGSVGASPIQNIGAYGAELSHTLVSIDFLDYLTGERSSILAAELDLGYRMSAMKKGRQGVVLAVELRLKRSELSEPIGYAQLASALGTELGDRRPIREVREAVLRLRASKGMVLSDSDPDSVSTGSFFTNPIVTGGFAASLPADAPRWSLDPEPEDTIVPLEQAQLLDGLPPAGPAESRVKLSAAWLIERAGIRRGFSLPGSRAAISSKHTLAIVNTGGARAEEIAELARFVQTRVLAEFGVVLQPEPVLVGLEL